MMQISSLFNSKPTPWGFRGDPHLWAAMAAWFEGKDWPDSAEIFHHQLNAVFLELTGHSIQSETNPFVEQFSHGGMSSGMISMQFWRERGIPILLKSYRIANWHAEHAVEKLTD